MFLAIFELSRVPITISKLKNPNSILFILTPIAFVISSVFKTLLPVTLFDLKTSNHFQNLPSVKRAVFILFQVHIF